VSLQSTVEKSAKDASAKAARTTPSSPSVFQASKPKKANGKQQPPAFEKNNKQIQPTTATAHDHDHDDYTHGNIPRHVGLICDGNGRWANKRNLPRAAGHAVGAKRLVDLIRSLLKERKQLQLDQQQQQQQQQRNYSVDCLTFYAFSTENWNRTPHETTKIFEAIEIAARAFLGSKDLDYLDIRVLGDLNDDRIPTSLKTILYQLEAQTTDDEDTADNTTYNRKRLGVCLAINYGGRRDIVAACRAIAEEARDGSLDPACINETSISDRLGTSGLSPPDLIVRTGGEHRLSNFLLWEAAYAELCVQDRLWPDFSFREGWKESLEWYACRKRNFGGRNE
jgi:undecaprenyl diphosphate synthase